MVDFTLTLIGGIFSLHPRGSPLDLTRLQKLLCKVSAKLLHSFGSLASREVSEGGIVWE